MTTLTNLTPWGYHGIFDCSNCDALAIKDESKIKSFLTEVAPIAGNSLVGDPVIMLTGKGDTKVEGLAAVQLLNNGTISANFVNSEKHIYLDVFSCKEFVVSDVESAIKKYFGSNTTINKIFIPRNAGAVAPE